MIASIVDTQALLEVIWVSLVAGIGVTAVYGVAIVGASRAVDAGAARRDRRRRALRRARASWRWAWSSPRSCSAS